MHIFFKLPVWVEIFCVWKISLNKSLASINSHPISIQKWSEEIRTLAWKVLKFLAPFLKCVVHILLASESLRMFVKMSEPYSRLNKSQGKQKLLFIILCIELHSNVLKPLLENVIQRFLSWKILRAGFTAPNLSLSLIMSYREWATEQKAWAQAVVAPHDCGLMLPE